MRSPFEALRGQLEALPYPETDCSDKVIIVTGANVGLGLEAARHFVRLNAAKVILGCRNVDKGAEAKADIETSTNKRGVVEVWPVDLGSFESVREFCRRAEQQLPRLDAVVENAGVFQRQYAQAEGYEETITVNVISTFLMALLLLPTLRRTATTFNVVPHLSIVSSDAHYGGRVPADKQQPIFETLKGPDRMGGRYNDSKLLEILVARELAREMDASQKPKVVLNTLNPGLCKTDLFRHTPWPLTWILAIAFFLLARTCEMGSRTLVAAAIAGEGSHGKYMSECKVKPESGFVRSEEGARVGKRVYGELMDILEKIEPGVRANI